MRLFSFLDHWPEEKAWLTAPSWFSGSRCRDRFGGTRWLLGVAICDRKGERGGLGGGRIRAVIRSHAPWPAQQRALE